MTIRRETAQTESWRKLKRLEGGVMNAIAINGSPRNIAMLLEKALAWKCMPRIAAHLKAVKGKINGDEKERQRFKSSRIFSAAR
jgi:hypothetical protein